MNTDRSLGVRGGQRPFKHAMAKSMRWMKAHPLIAKSVPTAIGFCFGDVLTQYGQRKNKEHWYDATKTIGMLTVGATVAGPIGLGILMLPGSSPAMIGLKVVVSEVVGCLIWQAAYLNINSEYRASAYNLFKSLQDSASEQQSGHKRRMQASLS